MRVMSLVKILISIDDTDNLESPGSGTVAENLAGALQRKGLAECMALTRHQLYVHEDIPYTAHNSAMCFPALAHRAALPAIIRHSQDFLQQESASGSDPGLCVAVADASLDTEALIAFGRKAKHTVLTKQAAGDLARDLGLHLSEHGGTGGGIIGALAAIGLRLHGSDGRFRGWHHLGKAGDITTPADLYAHADIDAVITDSGQRLLGDIPIIFAEDTVKTVLLEGLRAVQVTRNLGGNNTLMWTTLSRKAIKRF